MKEEELDSYSKGVQARIKETNREVSTGRKRDTGS